MAERHTPETTGAEDLDQIDEGFRGETADPATTATAQTDTDRLQQAQADGLLMSALPLDQIDADAMVRDRSVLDETEMAEMRDSIAVNGLRLPIEVYELAAPGDGGERYGLLSGYRRLMAMRALHGLTGADRHATIRALIRPRAEADTAFAAMVEENEVRSELSQYERGRIAVVAVQHGAFVNVEEAVNRLFASASKAKRSKVRSFALIFEELGDMLSFPELLSERRGLKLAQALRDGAEPLLREALGDAAPATSEDEWANLDTVIARQEVSPRNPSRGGRPRAGRPISGWQNAETLHTSAGITIRRQRDEKGFVLRFEGKGLDTDLMDSLMREIRALLEK